MVNHVFNKIIKKASSIADENAENEFDKNRRETLADVSEISNHSSDPKSIQESDEISENDETFPVIIDETLSEKSGNGSIFSTKKQISKTGLKWTKFKKQ